MSNFQEIHCIYIYLNKYAVKRETHNNNNYPKGRKRELVLLHWAEKLLNKNKEPAWKFPEGRCSYPAQTLKSYGESQNCVPK